MTKLTLSVDRHVVHGAKRYAASRGTSVSRLVETMLRLVASSGDGHNRTSSPASTPVLARLKGSLSVGDIRDYRRHLERKYR
jgi:hypothetical protein